MFRLVPLEIFAKPSNTVRLRMDCSTFLYTMIMVQPPQQFNAPLLDKVLSLETKSATVNRALSPVPVSNDVTFLKQK